MIRALIVDDEPHARAVLRIRLAAAAGFEVVAECDGGRAAVRAIEELEPDLVFLDIRMPDMGGFDVLRALPPERLPHIVFVTAYDEHALEAFDVNAVSYLLKPFDEERFQEVLEHCRRFFAGGGPQAGEVAERLQAALAGLGDAARGGGRIVVRSTARTTILKADDIDWIEADGNYARIHTNGGDVEHLVSRPLGELEGDLDPARFVRIHRSTIVNLDRVVELRTRDRRDFVVVLESGHRLRLSRTYRDNLERALGDRI